MKKRDEVGDFGCIFSIAMMTVMIAIGCLLARKVPFTAERRELLIAIIVNVAMPWIILNSIFHHENGPTIYDGYLFNVS